MLDPSPLTILNQIVVFYLSRLKRKCFLRLVPDPSMLLRHVCGIVSLLNCGSCDTGFRPFLLFRNFKKRLQNLTIMLHEDLPKATFGTPKFLLTRIGILCGSLQSVFSLLLPNSLVRQRLTNKILKKKVHVTIHSTKPFSPYLLLVKTNMPFSRSVHITIATF